MSPSSSIGERVVVSFVPLVFVMLALEVSLAAEVAFCFRNGAGGSKMSSSFSLCSSSLGFSSGSRDPVVIFTLGLEWSLNFTGGSTLR